MERAISYQNNLQNIGPLHDPVTWYKIRYTGQQAAQWDFQNKGRCIVLEVPLRNLLTSILILYHVTGSCKGPIAARRLAILIRPNKAERAVHGCHYPGDMAVRTRKVLARPWVGVRVCHLLFLLFLQNIASYILQTKAGM